MDHDVFIWCLHRCRQCPDTWEEQCAVYLPTIRDLQNDPESFRIDERLWRKMNGEHLTTLFYWQPKYIGQCPREKVDIIDGSNWVWLLQRAPDVHELLEPAGARFTAICIWEKLSGDNWAELLCECSEFDNKIEGHWDKLNGENWAKLLCGRAEFADKCDWGKLAWKQVRQLLENGDSTLAQKCRNWQKWDQLEGSDWVRLLLDFNGFDDKIDGHRDKLNGENWAELLCKRPEFADKCDWDKLEWKQVRLLLESGDSTLAQKCRKWQKWDQLDWNQLTGNGWVLLLRNFRDFDGKIDGHWDKLDGKNWVALLHERPEFAPKCNWSKLNYADWKLVKTILHDNDKESFVEKFRNWLRSHELPLNEWSWLLSQEPSLADECLVNVLPQLGYQLGYQLRPNGCESLMELVKNPDLVNNTPTMRRCAEVVQREPGLMVILPNKVQNLIRVWLRNHNDNPAGRMPYNNAAAELNIVPDNSDIKIDLYQDGEKPSPGLHNIRDGGQFGSYPE